MVVWGGATGAGGGTSYLDTGARYDPPADTWTATSSVGSPAGRSLHSAVWTGSEIIVWGGMALDGAGFLSYLDTGARYNPATDTWKATSISGAPEPRALHTAVWTGSSMVIWGGQSPSAAGSPGSGGIYDPSTDTWCETSTVGAPLSRYEHTAVWSGSEMVVWGGYSYPAEGSGERLGDGGRLDPRSNSWTPLPSSPVIEPRCRHTAVWTGKAMVVWGGWGAAPGGLSTGGCWTASSGWTATGTTGAPDPRQLHVAVWTGNEMLVWGGVDGAFKPLGTGGRFSPESDSWLPMPQTDAPAPRSGHTGVWTGVELVVWGGRRGDSSSSFLDSGGRYRPGDDRWVPTASVFRRDTARISVTWTGSEMIVWGGSGESLGGRKYCPATGSWTVVSNHGAPGLTKTNQPVCDGLRDDRVERGHRGTLQPGKRHLDGGERSARAGGSELCVHRLDGDRDDRLGRRSRRIGARLWRPIQTCHRHVGSNEHAGCAACPLNPGGSLDGHSDDCVVRQRRQSTRRRLRPGDGHMAPDEHDW